jgi:hypothetical protein
MMGLFAGTYFYFPKFSGRMMSEKLGNWSFWIMFVGMNLTFFPMHYSGLLGMPRRIYTYDADQGYTLFNQMSSIGTAILGIGVGITLYNLVHSWFKGDRAAADPWGGGTLEWSIPSPPPEYNFAELPKVTSRYPVWDAKTPELTREVPHTESGDRRLGIAGPQGVSNGKEFAETQVNPTGGAAYSQGEQGANVMANSASSTRRLPTAKELGIPMPNPSIMPLVCATGVVFMFCGLLFLKNTATGVSIMLLGAVWWVVALYNWLTTPLEDAH